MKWLNRLFGGPKDMAALPAGNQSTRLHSADVSSGKDGGSFSFAGRSPNGPVLAAFFKVSCPTCQYTFRFWNASTKRTGTRESRSSASRRTTSATLPLSLKEYGVTFRTQLDDPNGYAVSNAYGLTNVRVCS